MGTYTGAPWRSPDEETLDLYPGLVVHDGRQSGSITFGQSRLPVWAITGELVHGNGWPGVEHGWEPSRYGWGAEEMSAFLHDLFEARGEFARLLLVLADAERCERATGNRRPWWETRRHRKRVAAQLRRCLNALEAE